MPDNDVRDRPNPSSLLPSDDRIVRDRLASASWIGPHEPVLRPAGERPAFLLRRTFTAGATEVFELTATARGLYEVHVNGQRVGDEELQPGFSSYRSRLPVQRWDVSDLIVDGENTVGIVLSDGWFRGRHGFERRADNYGERTSVLLSITADGLPIAVTDAGWLSAPSWISRADLMDGQWEDRRRFEPDWSRNGRADEGWDAVEVGGGAELAQLVAEDRPPIRRVERRRPSSVAWVASGTAVVDFGQNLNGWVRLTTLGERGTELRLTHGEHLDAQGRVDTDHLRAFRFSDRTMLPAGQIDQVVSAGVAGDVFEPRHTTHGFRYVEIDGYPEQQALDVEAVVVQSDLREAGAFHSSDAELNALHEVVRWSFRGNACGLPTDCPQRERSGFTGDWQVFVETATRMYDVTGFSSSWLRDLAADQWSDGRVPTIVPNPSGNVPSGIVFEDMSAGSAGWGDAAVLVPWELWRVTGDLAILAESYPAMRGWVDYAARSAASGRHPDRAAARPVPAPHEEYLWDTGFHFGEWLEPGVEPRPDPTVDHGVVATAFLHRSAHLLALTAGLIGNEEDARRYTATAAGALDAWRTEYIADDGGLALDTQATYARALAFGLVPQDARPAAAERLAALVGEAGMSVGTGFLSTGQLLQAMADHGRADRALELLRSHHAPSWLAMLDEGATTMWEWWNGVDGGAVHGSLNHYSKGAVASFLHTHVAGLRLPAEPGAEDAGGRLILIEPVATGVLESANASWDLPAGTASVSWHRSGSRLRIAISVPERAVVTLPDGSRSTLPAGDHVITADAAAEPGQ